MKKEKIKSIGYIRTSSEAKDRQTLGTQRANIDRHVEYARKEMVDVLIDNAYSGKESKRPGFLNAMAMIERGEVDNIVVDNLDRFSRDTAYAIEALKKIEAAGGSLTSIKEDIDFSTVHGKMMFKIFITMGEYFLDLQREKVIENKANAILAKK